MVGTALQGFVAGLASTALMSIVQFPFWLKWSTVGILEWHENVCIAAKLLRRNAEGLLAPSFLLHFLNGGLAAMFYALALDYFSFLQSLDVWVLGILLGGFLWIATLAPIHRPITGVSITRHPLGARPAVLSIAVHMLYGLSTAYITDYII
ncbi:MAG: hypothetical protein QW420_05115 [Candidatus Caldarchaeum sp.]